MELLAVTSQLNIVYGQLNRSSNIPGLLAQSAPSKSGRGRDNDFLFVHLTLAGSIEETTALYEDLLDNISLIYYKSSGSVTAALRKAIIDTNRLLLARNLNNSEIVREGAITCSVQKGDEIYIAQVGEALAFIGRNFGIERIQGVNPQEITPLGRTAGIDISYYHNWLQPGDMLLLADPRLAYISTKTFEPILINADIESGISMVSEIVGEDSARLILTEFTDEAPGYIPDEALPSPRVPSRQHLPPPTQQPKREAEFVQPSEPVEADEAASIIHAVDVEAVETTARRVTSKTALSLSLLTAWIADLLDKIRPGSAERVESGNWALPAILAIAIPVIVGVVVVGVYLQRGQAVQLGELKRDINSALNLARSSQNEEEAELLYMNALGLISDAESIRPNDGDIARYRGEALTELDGLSGVTRLTGKLIHLFPTNSDLISLAVSETLNEGVFVLDDTSNQVFRLQMSE